MPPTFDLESITALRTIEAPTDHRIALAIAVCRQFTDADLEQLIAVVDDAERLRWLAWMANGKGLEIDLQRLA